ncbi:uncharacterized protein LOC128962529 [Oppia nitens]|uniref:uncharacterized protein LOC128962529 n=1 Tax=Oppia nitens TaxID=1686743 RepID=UPI0023DC623F|nr:uncharacterized protein LOC128962529 [Oppia nitens]
MVKIDIDSDIKDDSVDQWLYPLADIYEESILNDDVLINILNMLNPKELFQLQRVSKQFQYCCQQSLKKVKVLRIRSQLMTDDECYTRNTLDINGLKIHFIEIHWLADKLPNIGILVINQELSLKSMKRFAENCPQIESLCFGPKFAETLTDKKLMAIMDLFGDRLNRFRVYCPEVLKSSTNRDDSDYNSVDPMIRDTLFAIMFEVYESMDNPYRKTDPVFTKVDSNDINKFNHQLNDETLSETDYLIRLMYDLALLEVDRRFNSLCGTTLWSWVCAKSELYASHSGFPMNFRLRFGDYYQDWHHFSISDSNDFFN